MNDAQRTTMRTHGVLVGRILLGLLFFVSGGQMLLAGAAPAIGMVGMIGLPFPVLLGWVVVLVKVLSGAGLILGYRVGQSAGALFIFTLLTVVLVHNTAAELGNALKNLSIMGGLLYVMAFGAGDGWKICKSTTSTQM